MADLNAYFGAILSFVDKLNLVTCRMCGLAIRNEDEYNTKIFTNDYMIHTHLSIPKRKKKQNLQKNSNTRSTDTHMLVHHK